MCDKEYTKNNFYTSYNPLIKSGLIPFCKKCLKENCHDKNSNLILEKFKEILKLMDKPFLDDLWESTIESVENGKSKDYFGNYIRMIQMPQYRYFGWGDTTPEVVEKNVATILKDNKIPRVDDFVLTDEIVDRWGDGHELKEYKAFEKKYQSLKNNYVEKTSMHTEALLKYIRYSVKEEFATAENRIKDAKDWGDLAKNAAHNAKINPSQLSASDLSDGLDTIGHLSRAVEQVQDIIPILPKFKERPQDKVDLTLWAYVNYVRDLKGLPPCEYKDLYRFYDELAKEYQALTLENEGDF